jgi:hypothetical protein
MIRRRCLVSAVTCLASFLDELQCCRQLGQQVVGLIVVQLHVVVDKPVQVVRAQPSARL